jgi:molybdopterin-guanine dinucleotide biosynthesis protein A
MGKAKAWLRFGDETLLERSVALLCSLASPVVVVAAPEQELPPLPEAIRVVRDPVEGQGPLQGIAVGLAALADDVPAAFVSPTDAPFLSAAFVRRMASLQGGYDIAVPYIDGYHHPLAAVYATHLHHDANALLAGDVRRPRALFDRAHTRVVERAELLSDPSLQRDDPELMSLRNINTPEEYQRALEAAGLPTG